MQGILEKVAQACHGRAVGDTDEKDAYGVSGKALAERRQRNSSQRFGAGSPVRVEEEAHLVLFHTQTIRDCGQVAKGDIDHSLSTRTSGGKAPVVFCHPDVLAKARTYYPVIYRVYFASDSA